MTTFCFFRPLLAFFVFLAIVMKGIDGGTTSSVKLQPLQRFSPAQSMIPPQRTEIKDIAAQRMLDSLVAIDVPVPADISPQKNVLSTFVRLPPKDAANEPATVTRNTAPLSRLSSFFSSLEFGSKQEPKLKSTKKTPFLLVHGFDSSVLEWRRLAPLLCEQREVYIPDILGWGFSDVADVKEFTPAAKLAHLKSFINTVVGEPCVVVGASLGGTIAITLAVEAPEMVEQVVLIDAQGFIDSKGPTKGPEVVARFGVGVLKSTPLRLFANWITYKDKAFATWEAMSIGRLHCLTPSWETASLSFLQSGGFVVSDKVPQVAQPSLVVWGRDDEIIETPATPLRFQQTLPRCSLRWIEECGHVPHLEQPEQTAREILSFLGDL